MLWNFGAAISTKRQGAWLHIRINSAGNWLSSTPLHATPPPCPAMQTRAPAAWPGFVLLPRDRRGRGARGGWPLHSHKGMALALPKAKSDAPAVASHKPQVQCHHSDAPSPPHPAPHRRGASSCRACLSQVVPNSRDQTAQARTPDPIPASALPRPLLEGTQQRDHLLRVASGLKTCSSYSVNRDSGVLSSHPCWPLGFNF